MNETATATDNKISEKETQERAHAEWLERQRRERAGPHAQRVRQMARSFLQQVESLGYNAYAIIGIPNSIIRGSQFEAHLEHCEDCIDESDPCDEGLSALFEDNFHDHVFAFKSGAVGEPEDDSGLAFQLLEDYSTAHHLLLNAETPQEVVAEPASPVPDGAQVLYTSQFWQTAYSLIDSPPRMRALPEIPKHENASVSGCAARDGRRRRTITRPLTHSLYSLLSGPEGRKAGGMKALERGIKLANNIAETYERLSAEFARAERFTPMARRLVGDLTRLVQQTGLPEYKFTSPYDGHIVLTPNGKLMAFGVLQGTPVISTITPEMCLIRVTGVASQLLN